MKTQPLQSVEEVAEQFKPTIGYKKVGSQAVMPSEDSDTIVGAFMVGIHQDRNTTHERLVEILEGIIEQLVFLSRQGITEKETKDDMKKLAISQLNTLFGKGEDNQ